MFRKLGEINEFRVTEKSVYRLIHQKGPISKSELLTELGGSLSNLNRLVNELENSGLILKSSKGSGRRPGSLSIVPDAVYGVGAYLNGDVLGMGLCDLSGNILEMKTGFFRDYKTVENVIQFFDETYFEITKGLPDKKILGVGLGTVGPMDHDCSTILNAHLLKGWGEVPFKSLLSASINKSVTMDYFAETALTGRLLFSPHDLEQDIGLIWMDQGIGSSIYNRGQLNFEHRDQSSFMSHQIVNFKGNPCICGRKGCLMMYAAIPALIERATQFIEDWEYKMEFWDKDFLENPWQVSPELEVISDELLIGNSQNQIDYIIEEMAEAYEAALCNFIFLLRPKELILCGRIATKYKKIFEKICEKLQTSRFLYEGQKIKFTWLDLDQEKMIQGGAALLFHSFIGI